MAVNRNYVSTSRLGQTNPQAVGKASSQRNENGQISKSGPQILMKLGIYNYVGGMTTLQIHMALRHRGWSRQTRDLSRFGFLFMAALWAGHYILPLWFLSFFFFLAYSQRPQMSTILPQSAHDNNN